MVVARADAIAVILCQITSQSVNDPDAIGLHQTDFTSGSLKKPSSIRPNRLFTADERIIVHRAGHREPREMEASAAALGIHNAVRRLAAAPARTVPIHRMQGDCGKPGSYREGHRFSTLRSRKWLKARNGVFNARQL
jgi:hypothetical protein